MGIIYIYIYIIYSNRGSSTKEGGKAKKGDTKLSLLAEKCK